MKTIFLFRSTHLPWMKKRGVDPMKVMLVVEADSENEAREIVSASRIGSAFGLIEGDYEKHYKRLRDEEGMVEYTLGGLVARDYILRYNDGTKSYDLFGSSLEITKTMGIREAKEKMLEHIDPKTCVSVELIDRYEGVSVVSMKSKVVWEDA